MNRYFHEVKIIGKYFLKLLDLSIKIYSAAIKGEEYSYTSPNLYELIINESVVGGPAYFYFYKREIIKDIVAIASLSFLRVLEDKILARFQYSFKKEKGKFLPFYDFGGGFLNFSLLGKGR